MPQTYNDLSVEHRDHVARITINRPDALNALTGDTRRELARAIEEAGDDPKIGVIVLTGAGSKAFCAGSDLKWEKAAGRGRLAADPDILHESLVRCLKPLIARVNGFAIGCGNQIAYLCDFTIASDAAVFGDTASYVGSLPGSSSAVAYLARVIGHKRAREMSMLRRKYSAGQALEWGLVNAVVPAEELDAEVQRWCDEILALSPSVIRVIKAAFVDEIEPMLGRGDRRHLLPRDFWDTEEVEGKRAIAEKRKPNFKRFLA